LYDVREELKHGDSQTYRHTDRQTETQTDTQAYRQTDIQTDTVIAIFCICISSEVTKQNGIERTML